MTDLEVAVRNANYLLETGRAELALNAIRAAVRNIEVHTFAPDDEIPAHEYHIVIRPDLAPIRTYEGQGDTPDAARRAALEALVFIGEPGDLLLYYAYLVAHENKVVVR